MVRYFNSRLRIAGIPPRTIMGGNDFVACFSCFYRLGLVRLPALAMSKPLTLANGVGVTFNFVHKSYSEPIYPFKPADATGLLDN